MKYSRFFKEKIKHLFFQVNENPYQIKYISFVFTRVRLISEANKFQ